MSILFFVICYIASVVGAICGVGGGIIIKPALDAFHVVDAVTISFLSGCTVLTMSAYSFVSGTISGSSRVETKTAFPLATGGVIGGLLGKALFSHIVAISGDASRVGLIQAVCLLCVTIFTLVYTLNKNKIHGLHIENACVCVLIGLFLGLLSSFLGIGGGPINLIVLFFFFSMSTKTAAENSLYIIFFSQLSSLLYSVFTASVPAFSPFLLFVMAAGGLLGGITGKRINKKIPERTVDRLFIILMIVIIGINLYNISIFG